MMINVIIYILILCWWDVMRTWWWLRSTIGSYGRLVLEAAYGEIIFHSIGCLGDISSGRVVEVSSWCITHARHTWVITSVGTVYDIFLFSWYKIYMCYVLKIYMYYKKNTSGFWRCPSPMTFGEYFDRPWWFF